MKLKKAFTLAEVLITLGVIGVVAAMTMPTLINKYQKKITVERLKSTYSILSQAIKLSEIENGPIDMWDTSAASGYNEDNYNKGKTFFEKYLAPYIKIVKECKYLSNECWGESYTEMRGNVSGHWSASSNHSYSVVLTNGVLIGIYMAYNDLVQIHIDINGKSNPNILGKDGFDMAIKKQGIYNDYINVENSGIYLVGSGLDKAKLTNPNIIYSCTKSGYGTFCPALIMIDGWQIKDDYPW